MSFGIVLVSRRKVKGVYGSLPNLNCYSRPEVLATSNETSFPYFPYFVKLHRCSGSKDRTPPLLVQCVPEEVKYVPAYVRRLSDKKSLTIYLKNHTKCKTECVLKKDQCKSPSVYDPSKCSCVCNADLVGPPGLKCPDLRKIWSNKHCACVCKNTVECPRRRVFNQKSCKCECNNIDKICGAGRTFDRSICGCRKVLRSADINEHSDSSRRGLEFWMSAMLIELFVMVFLFEAFLYSRKSGVVHFAVNRRSKKTTKKETEEDKVAMTYKGVLKRAAINSFGMRRRSTRQSSVHPISPPPFIDSQSYEFDEDVFAIAATN
eukprot:gene14088-15560_t